MLMFDSLNRRMLAPYGCEWTRTPNFQRLADRAVTFDNAYIGSMCCIPARRELHTGRYNFLHRGWGPLEPFDDSMPAMLRDSGVYTHLATDHYHYWENGGCTYHTMYSSFEIERGQEYDLWKGVVRDPVEPEHLGQWRRPYWVNREFMQSEEDHTAVRTVQRGLEFIERNHEDDNWFLQIECFDPHEPYFAQERFRELYAHEYDGPHFDWPAYRPVNETPEEVDHCRREYAALLSLCDAQVGRLLDMMDEKGLWDDTMLIVNTDHGFLLGEHGWWAKALPPWYQELANTPLFIWDPRSGVKGERRKALVQTIDLAPTLLDFFGLAPTRDMEGVPLGPTTADDTPVREAALFGMFGCQVNVTDGRYVYMRAAVPGNTPCYEYTLMPQLMRTAMPPERLREATLGPAFPFTKGCPTLKVPGGAWPDVSDHATALFDLQADPGQEHPLDDADVEAMMLGHLARLMQRNHAPGEQFARLGLDADVEAGLRPDFAFD